MATIYGGTGDDNLIGTNGNDLMFGFQGNDTLFGGHGNDTIYGDSSPIYSVRTAALNVTPYDDIPEPRPFHDSINGGSGNDMAFGMQGNDTVNGDAGNDSLSGGVGSDNLSGGVGNDLILGDSEDFAHPDQQYVIIADAVYSDWMNGGAGNDRLYGEIGQDTVLGGAGNDTLSGGSGNDMLTGDAGRDVFLFEDNLPAGLGLQTIGFDTITDFRFGDKINLADFGLTFVQVQAMEHVQGADIVIHDASNLWSITVVGGVNTLTHGASDFIL